MASASPSSSPQGRMPNRRKTHASLAGTGCASSLLTNAARERVMERGMMKLYLNSKKGQAFFVPTMGRTYEGNKRKMNEVLKERCDPNNVKQIHLLEMK